MDFDRHLREMAAHLVWMDSFPGAQAYVRERLRELRRAHPMYEALPALILELVSASSSPSRQAEGSTPESRDR